MSLRAVYNAKDLDRLRSFYDVAETHFRGLEAMRIDEETYSCIVVPAMLQKLPDEVRINLTRAANGEEEWMLSEFLDLLEKELMVRENLAPLFKQQKNEEQFSVMTRPRPTGIQKPKSGSALKANDKKCAFCLGNHSELTFGTVTSLDERKGIIRKFGRCFVCLNKGHRAYQCRKSTLCSSCKGKHHESLCDNLGPASNKQVVPSAPAMLNANAC